MHPQICTIGPVTIYSYGLTLALAFIVGSFLVCAQAKKEGISPEIVFNFTFFVFISGVIGARAFYVLDNFGYYLKNPKEIIMLQQGGLAWFGGLISAVICGVIYLKQKKLSVYRILDLVAPFVALAQAIGRIGCLLNGCCFGKVSQFGFYFPVHDATLIPTQIYSSLGLIAIFIYLRLIQDRPHQQGQIFSIYLLLYSTKRFIVEFWRADSERIFWNLTLFQLISIAIFLFSLFLFLSVSKPKD